MRDEQRGGVGDRQVADTHDFVIGRGKGRRTAWPRSAVQSAASQAEPGGEHVGPLAAIGEVAAKSSRRFCRYSRSSAGILLACCVGLLSWSGPRSQRAAVSAAFLGCGSSACAVVALGAGNGPRSTSLNGSSKPIAQRRAPRFAYSGCARADPRFQLSPRSRICPGFGDMIRRPVCHGNCLVMSWVTVTRSA